nr:lamin tail domain-containing protein 2 isoform X2 [Manis javanica]
MFPEPRQEALSPQEPVSGHLGPPAGTPEDLVAPECPQDTKPSSTRVVFSDNRWSVPESLDPCTLRLLWGQRELEIQALRWAIQNRQDARHCHILQEVAGLPPERSSHSQEKVLQHQVQKLTLELKEQKEKAQLEKAQLEERLLQTLNTRQQLEAELQAFQKSCLLQLARSSWVGRMLRSSTGSVEVVTAETLMDSSDVSENDQGSTAGEGFRLEDVDWNSIAHRYPNLFTKIKSYADQDPTGSCLKIVAVSRRGRFVRILNQSPEETAELSGLVLQQLVRGFPERTYRFPPGTRLGPRQLVTVWGEGRCGSQGAPPSSLGREPVRFHSSPGCVTLLLNPKGETLSEHQAPHTVAPASRLFSDDTDSSTDCFPLSEAQSQADSSEQPHRPRPPRAGRLREARAGRRRLGTRGLLPCLTTGEHLLPREGPARSEGADTGPPERLPTVLGARMPARGGRGGPAGSGQLGRPAPTPPRSHAEAALGLRDGQAGNQPRVRVCRRSVDRCCPMVALSVQSTAESRFGFRFLSCPPITADARWQV